MGKELMNTHNVGEGAPFSRRAELIKILNNSSLIEAEPSIKGLTSNIDENQGGSIYYGTGFIQEQNYRILAFNY